MIHPTAIIAEGAIIARDVSVGAYCVIGPDVEVDAGATVHAHVVIGGPSRIGPRVVIHPFAVVGGAPQDRTYAGEPTTLVIGADTVIREHVTVHRGTAKDKGRTSIGARCLLMVGTHVAHDAVVGDDCIIANACQLAGHVELQAGVVLGGAVALAPYVCVGELAFVAAGAGVEQDVPPYHIAQGDRARVRALNVVGLRRAGVDARSIEALKRAHRAIYRTKVSMSAALLTVDATDPRVMRLVEFLRSRTTAPRRIQ